MHSEPLYLPIKTRAVDALEPGAPNACPLTAKGYEFSGSTHGDDRIHQGACTRDGRDDGPATADRRASSRHQLHAVGGFLHPQHRTTRSRAGRRLRPRQLSVGDHGFRTSGRRAVAPVRPAGRYLRPSPAVRRRPGTPRGGITVGRCFDRACSPPHGSGAPGCGHCDDGAGSTGAFDYSIRRRQSARSGIGSERHAALGRVYGRCAWGWDARRRAELALGIPDQRALRPRDPRVDLLGDPRRSFT